MIAATIRLQNPRRISGYRDYHSVLNLAADIIEKNNTPSPRSDIKDIVDISSKVSLDVATVAFHDPCNEIRQGPAIRGARKYLPPPRSDIKDIVDISSKVSLDVATVAFHDPGDEIRQGPAIRGSQEIPPSPPF